MSLEQLLNQQEKEIKDFHAAQVKAWQDLKKSHETYIVSAGGEDNLTPEIKQKMDKETQDYHKEWSMENGPHYKEITKRHENERKAEASGKSVSEIERDKERQKIAQQQAAIRERNKNKKRGR